MAKRLIKPDGLWTPPHLRRGPERPPTGRRFVNRRCCCTPGADPCSDECNAGTTPLIMAVTIANLANGTCGSCPDINGTYEVPQRDSDPCAWLLDITGTCDATAINIRTALNTVVFDLFNSTDSPPGNFARYTFAVTTPTDCSAFVDEALVWQFGGSAQCDYEHATMTFSSG